MAVFSEIVVRHNARLLKPRTLPSPGKVLVKKGDTVGPTAIIAKTDYLRESPRVVDLRAEFKMPIQPDTVESIVLKKAGERVKAGEPLARMPAGGTGYKELPSPCDGVIQYVSKLDARILISEDADSMEPMCVVPVSSILKSNPKWIRTHVTVREGQYVKEGQIIAGYLEPGTFSAVYAPISGIVARICPLLGNVSIVRPMETLKVTAHVPGRVVEIIPNYGAVIESLGCYIEGVFGAGAECHGILWVMTKGPGDVLESSQIGPEVDGRIIVAGAGATYEAMEKAFHWVPGASSPGPQPERLGQAHRFRYDNDRRRGIHGHEPPDLGALIQNHGALASMDGTTRLSGETLRPWIFVGRVPDGTVPGYEITETGAESRKAIPSLRDRVQPGDRVRCVRQPYLGLWGLVEQVMPGRIPLESEGLMEAVRVRLDGGSLVDVAEANVEIVGRDA